MRFDDVVNQIEKVLDAEWEEARFGSEVTAGPYTVHLMAVAAASVLMAVEDAEPVIARETGAERGET